MGRPATGSIRQRANTHLASVPDKTNACGRCECSFDSLPAAERWVDQQLARKARGLPPLKPRRGGSAPPTSRRVAMEAGGFVAAALAWHAEHYDELLRGGPDRANQVQRDLTKHLMPVFKNLLSMPAPDGRQLVKDWVRVMSGRKPKGVGSTLKVGQRTYARRTVNGWLEILSMVLDYARASDPDLPDYLDDIRAMDQVGKEKQPAPVVSIAVTAQIAAHMHVIHQLVLWLLRIAALRISEAFGLRVQHYIEDDAGNGFLLAGDQGGKAFLVRDDDGSVHTVHHKKKGKTASARRLVALPPQMAALIRTIIVTFHTDANGTVDLDARLVPIIRSANGGQGGFRQALKLAAFAIGGVSDDPDDFVVPHDMRKNAGTDVAWAEEVSELLERRFLGHRAGSDVFAAVYTLDSRLTKDLAPVAKVLEAEIAASVGELRVPTRARPVYGKGVARSDVDRYDAELFACGWQVHDRGERITTREAAAHLGQTEQATRRALQSGLLAGTKNGAEWLVELDDVIAFQERFRGMAFLPDVADAAGVDYRVAYRVMRRLGIEPSTDPHSRTLLLHDGDAERIAVELERLARLHQRAVPVPQAASLLGCSKHTIDRWCATGRLEVDPEGDGGRSTYVTRASISAELERRAPRRRPTVKVEDFSAASGIDETGISALVRARVLVWARRGYLTQASVRAWATGYRPDLLESSLLA